MLDYVVICYTTLLPWSNLTKTSVDSRLNLGLTLSARTRGSHGGIMRHVFGTRCFFSTFTVLSPWCFYRPLTKISQMRNYFALVRIGRWFEFVFKNVLIIKYASNMQSVISIICGFFLTIKFGCLFPTVFVLARLTSLLSATKSLCLD